LSLHHLKRQDVIYCLLSLTFLVFVNVNVKECACDCIPYDKSEHYEMRKNALM